MNARISARPSSIRAYAERRWRSRRASTRLEAKLRAIEEHPGIDQRAVLAATTHTRLLCSPPGTRSPRSMHRLRPPARPSTRTARRTRSGRSARRRCPATRAAARSWSGLAGGRDRRRARSAASTARNASTHERVELRAGAADDLVFGLFRRERLAVRAVEASSSPHTRRRPRRPGRERDLVPASPSGYPARPSARVTREPRQRRRRGRDRPTMRSPASVCWRTTSHSLGRAGRA